MYLKLRQVYFEDNQKLDEHCTPYDCTGKEPVLYENQHILDLVSKGDHYGNQYWGLTSWRKYEKTELTYKDIVTDMSENDGYDVYLYNNYGNEFNLLQNDKFPIGKIIRRLYSTGVLQYSNPNLEWVNIFCNYWVARPEIVDKYVETFLKPVQRAMETDKEIIDILKKEKFPYRGKQYPYHPFVMEYLFGLFLYHNKDITYHRVPDKTLKRLNEDIQEPEIDIPVLSEVFIKPTEIIDTRKVSKQYDDILIVWKK